MRAGTTQLNRRIADLEGFSPQSVQRRDAPEVEALETAIEETLVNVFGHNTVEHNRYRAAATLDHGPRVMRMVPDWIAARGGGGGQHYEDLNEVHRYLAEGKQRALVLLRQAVRGLEERIADHEAVTPERAPALRARSERKVFLVHGHDGEARETIARFLSEKLGLEAVILHERPNKGRTIITKFREESADVGFAVVLMTPDDIGKATDAPGLTGRARQNVVFELGFFIGALGPDRVAAILKGDVERPSDFEGVVYISFDKEDWRTKLGQELQAAGYAIDWNRVMGQ